MYCIITRFSLKIVRLSLLKYDSQAELLEQHAQFLHTTLGLIGLGELYAQRHVRQLDLSFLHLKQARLDRVLDDELDRRDRLGLSQSMLRHENRDQ